MWVNFSPLKKRAVEINSSLEPYFLQPTAARWVQQYGAARPLEIR
jgi:hypothetical protein